MKNQEIAKIFYSIAKYLEMDGVAFKPYAYERAGNSLEALEKDVKEIYNKGGLKALMEIPGVGKNIAEHIEDYLKSGKIKIYERLKKKLPLKIDELIKVEGMGPRKVKILYQKLGIKNLKDLEKAAKKNQIAPLFGFGQKTEENILQGIEFLKKSKGRFLLGDIIPMVKEVFEKLKNLKEVKEISLAGSLRRKKETIGDVDILVSVDNSKGSAFANASADAIADFFVSLPGVEKVWGKGGTKASVHMRDGFDMDLRIVPQKSYGSALQYFTGSKEHNIVTRKIAIARGLKLSEYGVFRGSKMIAGSTEQEVYKAIGLDWLAPELRENEGEIEAALRQAQGKLPGLPKLVELGDIKGDLHCHSNWNGGKNSIEEMASSAINMGYEYIGISDHTKFLRIEHGLNEKQLLDQREEIRQLNLKFHAYPAYRTGRRQAGQKQGLKFRILHGCEANILNDGSVDIKDEILAKLDYVIAGVHSTMKMEKQEMTSRLIKAMKNSNIDIISHPTGRLIGRRDEYQIDFDKILQTAKETGTILEINSSPQRLDLNGFYIRRAKEAGVKMLINTDSHQKEQLLQMEYGVSQARRGWAEKEDIINTRPVEKLLEYFKPR